MLKLSIKDIRIYWFTFVINLMFWTIMAPASIQNADIYMMLPVGFALLIIMIPLGNDMRDERDILYASLPIKRSRIVLARYFSSFILTALAFLWIIFLGLIIEKYLPGLNGGLSEGLSFESILVLVLITTIVICIYLPFVYRFGFGAVITGGVAVTAIVMGGFWIVASYLISSNTGLLGLETQEGNNVFSALMNNKLFYQLSRIINHYGRAMISSMIFLIAAAAITASIIISIKIFSRKEF